MLIDAGMRVLADAHYDSERLLDSRGSGLFYHRGDDVRLQLALSNAGTYLTATDVGTIRVVVKAVDATPATTPLLENTYFSADCDHDFEGEVDWKLGDKQLLEVIIPRASMAFEVGTYRLIIVHEDIVGLRITHADTLFEVREDRWENPSILTPPAPVNEYFTKEESNAQLEIALAAAETAAAAEAAANQAAASLAQLLAQIAAISAGSASPNYTSDLLANAPTSANSTGDAEFLRVYAEVDPNEDSNGLYYREDGESAWIKVPGDLTGRVVNLEGASNQFSMKLENFVIDNRTNVAERILAADADGNALLWWDIAAQSVKGKGLASESLGYQYATLPKGFSLMVVDPDYNILAAIEDTPTSHESFLWDYEGVISYGQSNGLVGTQSAPIINGNPTRHFSSSFNLRRTVTDPAEFVAAKERHDTNNSALNLFGESGMVQMALHLDELIEEETKISSEKQPVYFLSAKSVGGQTLAALSKGASNNYYSNLISTVQGMQDRATADGKTFGIRAIPFNQGESDGGLTQAQRVADLQQLQTDLDTDIKAITGQAEDVHLFIVQSSQGYTSPPLAAASIARARADVEVDGTNGNTIHLVNPNYHLEPADFDAIHFNGFSNALQGCYVAQAYVEQFYKGGHKALKPLSHIVDTYSVSGDDKRIILTMQAPYGVMVDLGIFTDLSAQDSGFVLEDSTGIIPLTRVTTEEFNQLAFYLDRAVASGPVEIRYGVDVKSTEMLYQDTAGGQARSAQQGRISLGGRDFPLAIPVPSFVYEFTQP